MTDYLDWYTMRDLDRAAARPKGSAFRCFKRLLPTLREGPDFIVLDHQKNAPLASRLHASGRLYRGSIHPVLLAPATAKRIGQQLRRGTPPNDATNSTNGN